MSADGLPIEDLCDLAVAVCLHETERLRTIAEGTPGAGADPRVRETLLMCHVFCGFPRTLSAYDTLAMHGLRIDAEIGTDAPDPTEPAAHGSPLFDAIYGRNASGVRGHLERIDPTFARWIAEHAYGRVLSRGVLSAAERELLAVAMLAAIGHDRQLASHARGAVRTGAEPAAVLRVLERVAGRVRPDRLERARSVVDRFARHEGDA